MKQVGIILGHDIEAHEWKGHLMSELAHLLAAQGALSNCCPKTGCAVGLDHSVSCRWAALPALRLVDGMHPGSAPAAGFVVGRYCCRTFEVKRRQMYEKALDALATSPVARGVNRWLLAGDWDTIM